MPYHLKPAITKRHARRHTNANRARREYKHPDAYRNSWPRGSASMGPEISINIESLLELENESKKAQETSSGSNGRDRTLSKSLISSVGGLSFNEGLVTGMRRHCSEFWSG